MRLRRNPSPVALLMALVLAGWACAGGPTMGRPTATASTGGSPTAAGPSPEGTDSGESAAGALEIRSTSSYIDSFNYFHLVGEIYNATGVPVTGIELMAHVADASGQAAVDGDERPLDGEIFSPLLYNLAPGESAPFDFFRILADGARIEDWQTSVTVANQAPTELERAEVSIAHTQLASNESGTVFLTGELVNQTSNYVLINSLAGALLAPEPGIVAANATTDFRGLLSPAGDAAGGDRTPFVIAIDGPAQAGLEPAFFVDAVIGQAPASAADVSVQVVNRFSDEFDDLHLVATVTNHSTQTLTVRLVAGLYAADGTVLDSASVSTPIFAAPGATVPVSFDAFNSLNRSVEEQARIDHVTLQIDTLWTYPIPYPVVTIQTANEVKERVGTAQYSFRGDVVNNTNTHLTSATLVLSIYDGASQLIATNWTTVYPETETFGPGDTIAFDIGVYLPTGVDLARYTFATLVQGYVKE